MASNSENENQDQTSAKIKMEIASIQENLKEEGWNLTNAGVELVSEKGKITDVKAIIRRAIDVDLRGISQGGFPEDINKTKYEQIPGNIVLQIQKIKNLSSPKSSESNSNNQAILKLTLTDGIQNVQAIIMDLIQNVNLNTFPGSKILITSAIVDVAHCFLLLSNSNTRFLGGKVESLIEKWELNRSLAKHTRDRLDEGGPPPWIPFGQKIMKQSVPDKNFKSLDLAKNKEISENSEFEAQRKGAILEATKIGLTKVFGGGNNKLLDYNVQQIVDAGFTIEQAEFALKLAKNNLDKALRNLQAKYKSNRDENSKGNNKSGGNNEEKKGGKGRNRHRDEDSAPSLKPSGKVSLFDFLEDKLPITEKEPQTESRYSYDRRNVNNAAKTTNKNYFKPNLDRGKIPYDERRNNVDRFDSKSQPRKSYESPKPFTKSDPERRNFSDRKPDMGKFENKKNFDGNSRSDKTFGSFKYKYEQKNGNYDYDSKNESMRNKANEKRGQNNINQSAIKSYNRSNDLIDNKKAMTFTQNTEKPPRFQKYQNQQNDNQSVQNWGDHSYSRITSTDYQLQNSMANLTLQQNIANFQNQNSQDGYAAALSGVATTSGKANNMLYQNVVIPTSQSNETRIYGTQNNQPPQSHMNTFGNRSAAAYIHQEVKNSAFPAIPNIADCTFKNNGGLVPGYNDFQSVFGNARPPSNSYPNASYLTGPNGLPQTQKPWVWNKGDKCMARYWEDQMYYNAVVTAVSDNTCVVRFTEYGNYEEVLQDHCIPISEES